jgi:hypothetical protein
MKRTYRPIKPRMQAAREQEIIRYVYVKRG